MIQTTAIIGMGALGLLYADVIASVMGKEKVTFIMNHDRLEKTGIKSFYVMEKKKDFPCLTAIQWSRLIWLL